ncbi:uncharacterized protein Triagg1_4014 [Trichoderma aggressivum f. europaeum]|uniref:Uncharacterized protein n=1 Tax=Trichoderma aggressivum f. europaeum TaxID=173218 RepID=A0AAE1J8Q0_9HYPO|nr:hypothetical protein Triagg1_4014 [Trichoderma aggressivum f. europaeum]
MLDVRGAAGPREFALYPELTRDDFALALELLPNVTTLILDDQQDLDVRFLGRKSQESLPLGRALRVLSLNNVIHGVLAILKTPEILPELVYLEVSGVAWPRSDEKFLLCLPRLRILKVRRCGIRSDRPFDFNVFDRRLWSLDLSGNELSDQSVDPLFTLLGVERKLQAPPTSSEAEAVFWEAETEHIPFYYLAETHGSSDVFLPGARYVVDPPAFTRHDQDDVYGSRSDGSVPIRPDTLDGVLRLLSRIDDLAAVEHLPGSIGLTHLHLSGNQFSAAGIERLLRHSNGQIEHFDCDSMSLYPPSGHYRIDEILHGKDSQPTYTGKLLISESVKMYGFSGLSQTIRAPWCSNLRSLRIHHSLVTNIPTVRIPNLDNIEQIYFAEKHILPGLDWAYSIAFLPDMNPRLQSLTLTHLPRQSFGPLVHKLTFFLRLLGLQEQMLSIMNKAEASRPEPRLEWPLRYVSGLRYLALEMESMGKESVQMSSPLELDAEELMASGETPFSFFSESAEQPLPPKEPPSRRIDIWTYILPKAPFRNNKVHQVEEIGHEVAAGYGPTKWSHGWPPRDLGKEKWVRYRESTTSPIVAVWAGNTWSPSPVVQKYRCLVLEYGVYEGLGPVTLNHMRAGAPPDVFIFQQTWLYAALPQWLERPPTIPTPVYEDVAAELRRRHVPTYEDFERIRKQSPHRPCFYWGGTFKIIDTRPGE